MKRMSGTNGAETVRTGGDEAFERSSEGNVCKVLVTETP